MSVAKMSTTGTVVTMSMANIFFLFCKSFIMKLWLAEPWKARVRYLRPYYASWKPRQTDHPISSPDVWYLPFVWTSWCTVMSAIILLALCLGDMMESFLTLQHLNFALYLNSPLIVIWWRFAVLMSESESNSRYYKSKQRHCNCSMCSHHWMRNGCVVTRLYNRTVPVTMVIPPLKHKCCQRRRVKFIVCKPESTRVVSMLLMLAGDVESNPGPDYQDYVALLPSSVCGCLKEILDWDNNGVDKDLNDIAAHLSDWEVKLSVPFQFKQHEIHDIKEKHSDPILLRRAALRLWKEKQGLHATYENLLKLCCEAGTSSVAQAICNVLKQRAKDCCTAKPSPSVSVKSQCHSSNKSSEVVHTSSSESGTQVDKPDSGPVVKFPPQGDLREIYFAQLRSQTKKIKIHYCHFSQSFMKNFLKREKNGDADFNDLFFPATDLFEFENSDDLMCDSNSKKVFHQVLLRQSYMNFELLKALIAECGTEEDKEAAEKYSEAFAVYAKRRVFECDPDIVSSELPGHDMVMFVLDKDHNFKVGNAFDFRSCLSEMLGMKYQKIIVHKFEPGSILMYVLVPSKYIRALTTTPLYGDRVLTLQNWNTRCIKFTTRDPVYLDSLNVLDGINFNDKAILEANKVKMMSVELEGAEYIALEYTESFCDESSADTGYIDYMDSLLSKKYRNIPAVKGVYYRSNPEEEKRPYPTVVIENLKPLKEVVVAEEEMPQVNQVSLLLDIANSVASFKSGASKYGVSVCTEAILVQESLSETEAKFCPLYGSSFVSNAERSRDQEIVPSTAIPLVELQWMSDVVKFIHFKGSVTRQAELPESHILKEMFDQKWLSKNDQFRPLNFKILCEEIQHLLETEKTWVGLVASFSDDLVEDEVQIHLILIGHTGVGKTSLRKHLKDEPIDMNETPTIVMEPEFLYRESVKLLASNPFKCIKDALSSTNSKVFLTMWDTGGQPIFQDLLPCFARLKCMYGIVFRLPDLQQFDSRPEIRPCDEHHQAVTSPFTNEDILYRNLAYVQAYSCSMKEKFENLPIQANSRNESSDSASAVAKYPAAVVVGTCKDKSGDFDALAVNETKLSLDRGIGEFVRNNNVSVYPVPQVSSYIHEIDNTVSGRDLDEGISHLRDNISRCAQESSTKVHKSWKVFELRLKRLIYTKYVNLGIVPLIEAVALGKECKVENPRAALMYFHELGVFMWYHMSERESMKDFVVIDPKTLLQILSKVYCFDPGSVPPELKRLLDKGIMTINFFISLLKQKASNIDDSWFMSFLEEHHLSIKLIHSGQDICYFLPSLLPITPSYENNLDQLSSNVSPLYIVPQSGYIPTGMFTRLLTALAGVTYGSTVWRIPLEDAHMSHVCRNQFEFVINNSLHLVLSEFSRHIRIDCVPYKSAAIKGDIYFRIASTIDVQLQRIVPRWMEEREFTFTFACKNSSCFVLKKKLHFLTDKDLIFKSSKVVTCSNGLQTQLLPLETVWLKGQQNSSNELSSRIFQEALKEGVLDINMASIMFVGINSPGSTSAKHLVFQEAVPTTYKATLLVNHEIYFKAEGDPTLKKLQPDTCTDVMLMSHCLCKSYECPFPQALSQIPAPPKDLSQVPASPRDLLQVPAAPKEPSQLPQSQSIIRPRPLALTIQSNADKPPHLFRPSTLQPISSDKPAFRLAPSINSDGAVQGTSRQQSQPLPANTVRADLKGTPVDLEDNKLSGITDLGQNAAEPTTDVKKNILQLANVDNFTKYMTQLKDKGMVEFYHVFDCGSHLRHMREILKIFIKNVSLCVLATDLSNSIQQEEIRLLEENKCFASRGLIIGTHRDLHSRYPESNDAEMKRLHDTGFIIQDETSQLTVFPMNCKEPERPDYEIAARIAKHSSLSATTKKFPFAWYLFGFKLRQVMAGLNRSTLSVSSECMIIAKELNMDRPTVEAALSHLSEQNMILYFPDILNDSVFSGINVFSQLFSLIYSNRCSLVKEQHESAWQLSIVTESHLKTVVDYIAESSVSVTDFILLFKKLLILAPYDGAHASYLMPCLLPSLSETEVDKIHKSACSASVPARIKCPSTSYEYITMLVMYLLTQTSFDWTISLNYCGAPVCLYKNCFKFLIESSQCFVNLSFFDSYLKISIDSSDNKKLKMRYIWHTILCGLEKIKIILNAHKMFDFKISFCCPCGLLDNEHTATYNRDQKTMTCDVQDLELIIDSANYQKWLDDEHSDEKEYPDILTVRNIVKKLAQWSDRWIRVAECLEVPSAMISTIRVITTHQHSGDTALYKVVEWWFANNPNPEWAAVNKVIEEFERDEQPLPKSWNDISDIDPSLLHSLSRSSSIAADSHDQSPIFDAILLTVMNCLMHNSNCEIIDCPCRQIQGRYRHLKASTVPLELKSPKSGSKRRVSSTTSSDSDTMTARRGKMRLDLNQNRLHPHYHISTRSHVRRTSKTVEPPRHRRSRSLSDLTPITEAPRETLTPQVGGAIKPGTPVLDSCGFIAGTPVSKEELLSPTKEELLSPAPLTPLSHPRPPLLKEISMSSDNLPVLCLNDCMLQLRTPSPLKSKPKRVLGSKKHVRLLPVREGTADFQDDTYRSRSDSGSRCDSGYDSMELASHTISRTMENHPHHRSRTLSDLTPITEAPRKSTPPHIRSCSPFETEVTVGSDGAIIRTTEC